MSNIIILFLVIGISVVEACAQSLSYLSYKNKSKLLFLFAWLMYLIIVYLLWHSYHYRGVGYINVIWSGVTTTLMLLIGYFYFGEKLSFQEWIGVVFVLFGIILMTVHNIKNHIV